MSDRFEQGRFACQWVFAGDRQAEEMGGLELLRIELFAQLDGKWVPLKGGSITTQVRRDEEEGIKAKLLEKVSEEIAPLVEEFLETEDTDKARESYSLPGSDDLFHRLAWLGPEMAEEY